MSSKTEAKGEKLLQKFVGRLPEGTQAQFYECSVTSADVADPAAIKKLIAEVKDEDILTAHYIMAHTPSVEIYAFQDGKQILIVKDHSARQSPKPGTAAEKLAKTANEKCPDPK